MLDSEGRLEQNPRPLVTLTSELFEAICALALDNSTIRDHLTELQREVPFLRQEIKAESDVRALTGTGPAMKAVRQAIQQVAPTDSTVLVLGETGTGKELVARAIHQLSPRREHLLVTVNCAALNPNILASELFGHEQGAFTGASRRRHGRFELAHRGTIFLDEIAEMPLDTQVFLLRALQERIIERVGSNEPVHVDVRVIAATHRDLHAAVAEGRFRTDLFYRLNVFPIHVPPLRERREDIPDLIRHFIHFFNRRLNKQMSMPLAANLAPLMTYHWPGNVRELENLVERAMIVSESDTLNIQPGWLVATASAIASQTPPTRLRDMEKQFIQAAIDRCGGRIYGPDGAATLLGLKPTTLYGKIRKHGIAHVRKKCIADPK
jgi:formate hydrogenlyase transcriptional activator